MHPRWLAGCLLSTVVNMLDPTCLNTGKKHLWIFCVFSPCHAMNAMIRDEQKHQRTAENQWIPCRLKVWVPLVHTNDYIDYSDFHGALIWLHYKS